MANNVNAWDGLIGADRVEFPGSDLTRLEIYGYCDQLSYGSGDTVRVKVHTTAKTFKAEVIDDSGDGRLVFERTSIPGVIQTTPADAYAVGCGWADSFEIATTAQWQSGLYLIVLTATGEDGTEARGEACFVVRPARVDRVAGILLMLATGTWVSYNDWGGANAYRRVVNGRSIGDPARRLSLARPWAKGLLRLPLDAPRYGDVPDLPPHAPPRYPCLEWSLTHGYSRHYADAGWAYYEKPFVRWAKANGYHVDIINQHDLHRHRELLAQYPAIAIVGHDEYWTWDMRDAIDGYVGAGGHLARFGGNFLWQVRVEEADSVQVCHKVAQTDSLFGTARQERTTTYWDSECVGRPGAATMGLTGVSGIYARYGAATPRSSGGYTVYRPDHWAFAGTDLYYGDVFGGAPARIASFEVDGVDYTFRNGLPYPTHKDGAPKSLEILAMTPAVRGELARGTGMLNAPMSDFAHFLEAVPPMYPIAAECVERGSGMVAIFENGAGQVFNGGSCEWVAGLIHRDPCVERITRNVLDHFLTDEPKKTQYV